MLQHLKNLYDIICINGDLHELIEKFYQSNPYFEDWTETDVPILKREHLLDAIRRFKEGNLSASDLYTWAEFLEMHEFLEYEENYSEQIVNVLFELANPEINQNINITLCNNLEKTLKRLE